MLGSCCCLLVSCQGNRASFFSTDLAGLARQMTASTRVVSLGATQFQRESCRFYNHRILYGESGAHNFYMCSHATHVQLWGAQCTSWHGVAEPGGAAWHGMAEPGLRQPVTYAVGGQYRAKGH